MKDKLVTSATITGLLFGYAALLYALIHILVLIDRSYFLSLAK